MRNGEVAERDPWSGLWGTGRGGRGHERRTQSTLKRGLLALVVLALAAPLAATAGEPEQVARADSYLAPALQRAATQTPNADVRVIVQSLDGSGARRARSKVRRPQARSWRSSTRRGRDRRRGPADSSPHEPRARDHSRPAGRARRDAGSQGRRTKGNPRTPAEFTSGEDWPGQSESTSSGRPWPALQGTRPKGAGEDAVHRVHRLGDRRERADFAGRMLAQST